MLESPFTAKRELRPRVRLTVLAIAAVAAIWVVTAWISRDVRPWAIWWTTIAVVGGLFATYIAGWAIAIVWASNRRQMIFRVVTVTVVTALLLVALEAAAWFRAIDYRVMSSLLFDDWSGPTQLFVDDPQLFYRRPANTSWSGQPRSDMAREWNLPIQAPRRQTFTTDSNGFRNLRGLSQADVVLLGDSYIEGLYVSDDETAAVGLQRLIQRPVVNLGTAGYGTLQQLVVLQQYALPLRPRLAAWFFFEGNDLYDDHGFEAALSSKADPKKAAQRQRRRSRTRLQDFQRTSFAINAAGVLRVALHPLFPKTVPEFGWFRDRAGDEHRMYFYDYATLELTEYELERFEITKAAFKRGAELARQHGVQLVVFYIPMKFRVYGDFCRFPQHSPCVNWRPWHLSELFMQFCAEANVECIDLAAPMRLAASAGELLYAPEDSHWNSAGHEFVARQLELVWNSAGHPH